MARPRKKVGRLTRSVPRTLFLKRSARPVAGGACRNAPRQRSGGDENASAAARFDSIPEQGRDIGAAEIPDLAQACRRGDVDLGHLVADDVDAH